MNKFFLAFSLIFAMSFVAVAQGSDDYNKNEVFVGFSHQNVGDLDSREGFNGVNASYVRNVTRYVGVKADFSAAFKKERFNVNVETTRSVYNFLGGVQIKDNASEKRLKPFAHALVGVGHNRNKISPANVTFSDTGFAGAFGGGLDIKINKRIDLRAIQVDYNPIYSNSRVDQNVRFGIGIVFK